MKPFTRHPYCPAGVPGDAIAVRVTDAGSEPDTIVVPAERRAQIVFTRATSSPCAAEVFPGLGVSATLPVGETALVEPPVAAAGEHAFQCATGVLRDRLIAAEEYSGDTDRGHVSFTTQGGPR